MPLKKLKFPEARAPDQKESVSQGQQKLLDPLFNIVPYSL